MTREFSSEQKHRAALREVAMRKLVYPSRIESGHLSKEQARDQIEVMEAIARDYEKLAEKERLV